MKTATLTYELVCAQINELVQNGEKITVRNVLSRTGGSTARLLEFIKRWREENNIGKLNPDLVISDELHRALLIDKSAAVAKTATAYKIQLTDIELLLEESNEILKSQELQLAESAKEINDLKQRVATLTNNENNYKEKLKTQAEKINADQVLHNEMLSKLARSDVLLENTITVNAELKDQVAKQQAELLQITKAKYQAESEVAVWQAKHQQLTEQMKSLLTKINKK
jgi:Plasmid replication region DNA-binding N-term.